MDHRTIQSRLLTCREVAERLRVSVAVVYTRSSTRQIRHERIGTGRGRLFIPEDAVEEYRRARTVPPAARVGEAVGPRHPVRLKNLRLRSGG
jgi:excisionase family DNA binding protein